jgi:hypothetical protein
MTKNNEVDKSTYTKVQNAFFIPQIGSSLQISSSQQWSHLKATFESVARMMATMMIENLKSLLSMTRKTLIEYMNSSHRARGINY